MVFRAGHALLLGIAPLLTRRRLRVTGLGLLLALQIEPYLDPCPELPVWHARLKVERAAELACVYPCPLRIQYDAGHYALQGL